LKGEAGEKRRWGSGETVSSTKWLLPGYGQAEGDVAKVVMTHKKVRELQSLQKSLWRAQKGRKRAFSGRTQDPVSGNMVRQSKEIPPRAAGDYRRFRGFASQPRDRGDRPAIS